MTYLRGLQTVYFKGFCSLIYSIDLFLLAASKTSNIRLSPPETLNLRAYSYPYAPSVHTSYTNDNNTFMFTHCLLVETTINFCLPTVDTLYTNDNNNTFMCTHHVPTTSTSLSLYTKRVN